MTQATTVTQALDELRPGNQWVCFDKDKIPYNPLTGQEAKANDVSTWATYEQARKASLRYQGIGREFLKDQKITGIDLDKCIDAEGKLSPFAEDIVRRLNSYTEYSPSGRGLHVWVHGNIPKALAPSKYDGTNGVEMYDCKRYFTVTDNHYKGTPTTIEDRQEVLLTIHAEITARRKRAKAKEEKPRATPPTKLTHANGDTPYGLKALAEECANLATTGEGSRNEQLNRSAYSLGQLVAGHELSRATVERELSGAAARAGLDDREIEGTLRSGIEAGIQSPRSAPATDPQLQTATSGGNGAAHITANGLGELPDASVAFVLNCLQQNEWGDSLLFAHLFDGKAVYDHNEKEWYLWHKHHWKRDDTGRIKHFVSGLLASVYLQTAAIIAKDTGGDDEQEKERKKKIQRLYARALEIRGLARCKNVLTFATSHLGINANKWDTNKWLLAVPNGVIDLKTGLLRDGKPGDYIRTVCPTEWQGLQAAAPRWEQFLQEIFEDRAEAERAQLIDFTERLFGYGITGETREHIFTVLYGEDGRNGKDTLQRAISYTLGQASGVVSKDVLLDSGKQHIAGAATPHLSDLQGKRLAWASEPEKGARFNIGQVKELSGGGDISTRAPYEKRQYTFTPTHLLILLTNHKPHADANDSAFWDRLRLITFNMRFVDKPQAANERKRDVILWDTLEQEASGVLAWLVRGCLAWQQAGLDTPQFITDAGQEYRKEEDTIGLFVDECCIITPNAEALAGRIYTAYSTWCNDGNMRPLNSTSFGRLFSKRFRKDKQRQGVTYYGVGLREPNPPFPDDSVNSSQNPSHGANTALQASLGDTQVNECEQCEGFLQKVSNSPILATTEISFTDKTIHTIHSQSTQNGVNPLDSASSGTVNSLENYSRVTDCMTTFEGAMNTSHSKHEATLQDHAGGTWCDNCILQHDLMNIGHERGYPRIETEGRNKRPLVVQPGRNEWLEFCQKMGYESIRSILRIVEVQA